MLLRSTYHVDGMTCAGCVSSVESRLNSLEGVDKASVNLADASVIISYDEDLLGFTEIRSALNDIGFGLRKDTGSDIFEEEKQNKARLKKSLQNTLLSFAFSIPVFLLSMVFTKVAYKDWIMLILSIPVLTIFGREFFMIAWKRARHFSANMDTLVALGTGTAFLFSLFNTLFPSFLSSQGLEVHVYYEAACMIISLILLGRYFEEKAKWQTSDAIRKLMHLGARQAIVVRNGKEVTVNISEIRKNDHVLIFPGDKIPVDGPVIEGESEVDEHMITGESLPVFKKEGDFLMAGTINVHGSMLMQASKIGSQTLLAHIIEKVREAQGSKAPVQKLADKVAGIFVPVVLVLALVSAFSWYFAGPEPKLSYAFITLINVLIIACPCALGLATPTALMVGIGGAAQKGILIRDGESLQKIHTLTDIVFDKTGTLTSGKPSVIKMSWLETEDPSFLRRLKAIEKRSGHPLGNAIYHHLNDVPDFDHGLRNLMTLPGKGVTASFMTDKIFAGNITLLEELGIEAPHLPDGNLQDEMAASTLVYTGQNGKVLAIFSLQDELKQGSAAAVSALKKKGLNLHLLSGDNLAVANFIGSETGIENVSASLNPVQKMDYISSLQKSRAVVAMVGDGINDAPALAKADAGIAIGTGTDIAIESAAITLVKGDLAKVEESIDISIKTWKTIKQNLFWAFFYNIIAIPIAAGILYPFTGSLMNPMIAGAAMAFSSVSVVLNSLCLRKRIG